MIWSAIVLGLIVGSVVGSPAYACYSAQLDTVHFHSSPPDFGIPPRRAALSWRGEHDDRPSEEEISGDKTGIELEPPDDAREEHKRRLAEQITAAEAQEDRGEWRQARQRLEQIAAQDGWNGILRDRVQILQQIEKGAVLPSALSAAYKRYRQGLDSLEAQNRGEAQDAFEQVYQDKNADFLRAHACYQLASLAWEWLDYKRAIDLYEGMLKEFPGSPKREDALIMLARCALLPFTPTGSDPKLGKDALDQLAREFPNSRFRKIALGLQGRLHYRAGDYSAAFWCYRAIGDSRSVEIMLHKMPADAARKYRVWLLTSYLKHLPNVHTYTDYAQTISAIDRARYALTPQDVRQFSALLRRDPDLPDPYLYYRLNHTDLKPADRKSLAQLADTVVAAHPATRLSPAVRARIAEVYYRDRQYEKALSWAEEQKGAASPYDQALYVRGATLQKLGRNTEALAEFRTLLTRCTHSSLRHAAREETAILCEALGDRIGALEQYFALDYTADIAYLLDTRMSITEVEACLARFRSGRLGVSPNRYYEVDYKNREEVDGVHFSRRDLLVYTLGILQLRAGNWDAAEKWFKQFKSKRLELLSQGRAEWESHASPDPLTTARALRRLSAAVQTAPNDNARAAALYKVATYYYSHGTLLLYNPLLWQQSRAWNYGMWMDEKHMQKQDVAATRAYMYRHEVYARSLEICKQIAQQYPDAPVAPQALYRGACSARYLANFNGWWRTENKTHNLWKEAVRLMHLCAVRYPHHPLAKEAAKYSGVFDQERKDAWDESVRADVPPRSIGYARAANFHPVESALA